MNGDTSPIGEITCGPFRSPRDRLDTLQALSRPEELQLPETRNVSFQRIIITRWPIYDGHRAARDTDELIVFVVDPDIPDIGCATTVDRNAGGS